ncbi:MAG: hypothetical protein AB7U47_12950 [Variibacter sp.]
MSRLCCIHDPGVEFLRAATGLPRRVSTGYTASMKDVGIRIRVQRELRDRFLEACRSQDRPASQVLREFMRAYVVKLESSKEDKDRSSSAESTPA